MLDDTVLKDGDIINVDLTSIVDGYTEIKAKRSSSVKRRPKAWRDAMRSIACT
ncbi:MAG: hypothetical protein U0892_05300 [Pirellulales bacterium]